MGIEYAGWILLSRQKGGVVSACNTGEIFYWSLIQSSFLVQIHHKNSEL